MFYTNDMVKKFISGSKKSYNNILTTPHNNSVWNMYENTITTKNVDYS